MSVMTTSTRAEARSWLDRFGRSNLVMLSLLGLAFAGLFFIWLNKQFGPKGFSIRHPEDWGHAYLVPLISGYYVWKHRATFARLPMKTCWPGLSVMLLGMLCFFVFVATAFSNHMFAGFSVVLTLGGLVLFVMGPRVFQAAFFPIAFLGFAVTISEMVMNKATWRLKLLASEGADIMLTMLFIDVEQVGNKLTIYTSAGEALSLDVAEACSGMRMVVAFIALAVTVAFLQCEAWWKRIAVMLLAVPVALLMNIVRVAILGLLTLWDPDLAAGDAHTWIGTVLLVPSLMLFLFLVWLLDRIVEPQGAKAS